MKKTEVLPLWQITFDPLKNRLKNIHQWSKTCIFFHQKSEGIAFIFCRYLNQNMRAFIFCRYCPPIVLCRRIWKTKKSSKIEGNTLGFLRRSLFPFNALGMPSFNNSVAPGLLVIQIQIQAVWYFDLGSTCCHVQTVILMTAWQIMLCAEFRIWIVALPKDLFRHGWTTWFGKKPYGVDWKNSYLLKNQI